LDVEFRHRKARTVDGNAIAEVYAFKNGLCADSHVESAVFGDTQLLDFAHFFDDAGEEAADMGFEAGFFYIGFLDWKEECESGRSKNGVEFEVGIGRDSGWVEN
jgi:hypothetical protein